MNVDDNILFKCHRFCCAGNTAPGLSVALPGGILLAKENVAASFQFDVTDVDGDRVIVHMTNNSHVVLTQHTDYSYNITLPAPVDPQFNIK